MDKVFEIREEKPRGRKRVTAAVAKSAYSEVVHDSTLSGKGVTGDPLTVIGGGGGGGSTTLRSVVKSIPVLQAGNMDTVTFDIVTSSPTVNQLLKGATIINVFASYFPSSGASSAGQVMCHIVGGCSVDGSTGKMTVNNSGVVTVRVWNIDTNATANEQPSLTIICDEGAGSGVEPSVKSDEITLQGDGTTANKLRLRFTGQMDPWTLPDSTGIGIHMRSSNGMFTTGWEADQFRIQQNSGTNTIGMQLYNDLFQFLFRPSGLPSSLKLVAATGIIPHLTSTVEELVVTDHCFDPDVFKVNSSNNKIGIRCLSWMDASGTDYFKWDSGTPDRSFNMNFNFTAADPTTTTAGNIHLQVDQYGGGRITTSCYPPAGGTWTHRTMTGMAFDESISTDNVIALRDLDTASFELPSSTNGGKIKVIGGGGGGTVTSDDITITGNGSSSNALTLKFGTSTSDSSYWNMGTSSTKGIGFVRKTAANIKQTDSFLKSGVLAMRSFSGSAAIMVYNSQFDYNSVSFGEYDSSTGNILKYSGMYSRNAVNLRKLNADGTLTENATELNCQSASFSDYKDDGTLTSRAYIAYDQIMVASNIEDGTNMRARALMPNEYPGTENEVPAIRDFSSTDFKAPANTVDHKIAINTSTWKVKQVTSSDPLSISVNNNNGNYAIGMVPQTYSYTPSGRQNYTGTFTLMDLFQVGIYDKTKYYVQGYDDKDSPRSLSFTPGEWFGGNESSYIWIKVYLGLDPTATSVQNGMIAMTIHRSAQSVASVWFEVVGSSRAVCCYWYGSDQVWKTVQRFADGGTPPEGNPATDYGEVSSANPGSMAECWAFNQYIEFDNSPAWDGYWANLTNQKLLVFHKDSNTDSLLGIHYIYGGQDQTKKKLYVLFSVDPSNNDWGLDWEYKPSFMSEMRDSLNARLGNWTFSGGWEGDCEEVTRYSWFTTTPGRDTFWWDNIPDGSWLANSGFKNLVLTRQGRVRTLTGKVTLAANSTTSLITATFNMKYEWDFPTDELGAPIAALWPSGTYVGHIHIDCIQQATPGRVVVEIQGPIPSGVASSYINLTWFAQGV